MKHGLCAKACIVRCAVSAPLSTAVIIAKFMFLNQPPHVCLYGRRTTSCAIFSSTRLPSPYSSTRVELSESSLAPEQVCLSSCVSATVSATVSKNLTRTDRLRCSVLNPCVRSSLANVFDRLGHVFVAYSLSLAHAEIAKTCTCGVRGCAL